MEKNKDKIEEEVKKSEVEEEEEVEKCCEYFWYLFFYALWRLCNGKSLHTDRDTHTDLYRAH